MCRVLWPRRKNWPAARRGSGLANPAEVHYSRSVFSNITSGVLWVRTKWLTVRTRRQNKKSSWRNGENTSSIGGLMSKVHKIALIAGDGIGKEVVPEGVRVLT